MIQGRIHGLDALRAIAMILGVFLHASIAYKVGYHQGYWVKDATHNGFFYDFVYFWVNSFRMPAFFLLAGFFARLLYLKIGIKKFSIHRIKRIILPFVASLIIILPITVVPFYFSKLFYEQGLSFEESKNMSLQFFVDWFTFKDYQGIMHLWFLHNLIVLYVFALVSLVLNHYIKISSKFKFLDRLFHVFKNQPHVFVFLSALPIAGVVMLYDSPIPFIWTGLFPQNPQLLYYGFFFLIGWFLHRNVFYLENFNKNFWLYLVLGTGLSVFLLAWLNNLEGQPTIAVLLFKLLYALQGNLLVFGMIGCFNTIFNKNSSFLRYLSDSAYWVYLIHIPFVVGLQMLLFDSSIPGFLRFWIVCIGALFACFFSYHFFVRYNGIGSFLHGKRHKKDDAFLKKNKVHIAKQ